MHYIPEPKGVNFLIEGGLYSVTRTALRETGGEETVYTKHQELKQASKHAPQPKHESLVATKAIFEFVVAEESISVPRIGNRACVLLVPEGVLPAVLWASLGRLTFGVCEFIF